MRGMNLFDAIVPPLTNFLGNLDKLLDKASAHADGKKFDREVLFGARLAPDMAPFSAQIQGACDMAKFIAAKISGKEPPSNPDTEKNFDELRARITTVREYLGTFTRADFEDCDERRVRHGWMPEGKSVRAGDYLDWFALPNFHFHMTTAYLILRHNGVPLGKMDYMLGLPIS